MSSRAPALDAEYLTGALDPLGDRLLAAAAEVFGERGYDGAGVAEIARRAGVTTGAIYSRYSGKAELLLEAVRVTSHDELAALFAETVHDGRVTDAIRDIGAHLIVRPPATGRSLLLQAFAAAQRDGEVAALLRARLAVRAGLLGNAVERAKRAGEIDPRIGTDAIAALCHALGLGFVMAQAIDAPRPDPESWNALIATLVGALAPPVTPPVPVAEPAAPIDRPAPDPHERPTHEL